MKHTPPALAHLTRSLDALRSQNRLRQRAGPGDASFCSNDYLGLATTVALPCSAGAGASRLIAGDRIEHGELEQCLKDWLHVDQTLLFSSGYAANVGVLSALIDAEAYVVSDALNHASIIDGLRLARARVAVVPHLDVASVEQALSRAEGRRSWVVTESYFSMDADTPDLRALRRTCDRFGAGLVVDEAHALGVFGPEGRGLCAAVGIAPDVLIGTLGKAFGASGAFVGGCDVLVDWLWNRARSHVFSTAMSPVVAAAARGNIERARAEPGLRERAIHNATRFRDALRQAGGDVRGYGPIVPWVIGTEAAALRVAQQLGEKGVRVVAIRPPTVPDGTSRLRFTFTAKHTGADVELAIAAARAALTCLGG